jgi:hypothetical protein
LNGVPYMCEWKARELFGRKAYDLIAPDLVLESRDLVENLSDNKLDKLRWGTNRSWHEGAGQKRLNQPEISSPNRFLSSKAVEISEKGQLTLLPAVSRVLALTNADPAPQKLTATDSHVWVAAGQAIGLKRFASLDGTDAATVATGAAQEVLDLASDGALVYIALGTSGTYRYGAPTTTTIEAFDSTTGFTGSGDFSSHTIVTVGQKQGTGDYKQTGLGNIGVDAVSAKSFGGAQNYSTVDQFKIWAAGDIVANAGAFEYRLITSGGNYFRRVVPVPNNNSGVWYEDTASRTTGFTSVGSPNWASIASFEVRHQKTTSAEGAIAYFDDLRTVTQIASASYCTWDARVFGWAKDRLYGAGISSGTIWRFYEVVSGTPSSTIYILPDGWEVTDIAELQGYVYFSAKRGRRGVVYAYDGTNAPFVAVQMPPGVQAISLGPFSGGGMLIGARKLTTVSSGGIGVLYRAFPTASGHLSRERIVTFGTDDGKDYGIRTCVEYSEDIVHYGQSFAESSASGLGTYLPETGGYARGLESSVGRAIMDSIVFKGRRIFTADGDGVWVEQSTIVSTGEIVSSAVDLNTASRKSWLAQESTFAPLVSGQSVSHAYSTDGGLTWLGSATESTVGATRLRSARNFQAETVHFRATLATNGASPTLYSTGLGGWPATKPGAVHQVVIRAYPAQKYRTNETRLEQDYGYGVLAALIALHDASTVVDYQPPWWVASQETLQVRVSAIQLEGDWGTTGRAQGGCLLIELQEVA